MPARIKDLIGSDVWLNRLIKDPDRDAFQAERGEKDKDLERIKPGSIPNIKPKKGRRRHDR